MDGSFQASAEIQLNAYHSLLLFHGSPTSHSDIFLPDTPQETYNQHFNSVTAGFCCGGHSHTQQLRYINQSSQYLNPGSIGMGFNWLSHKTAEPTYYGYAEYAVLTCEEQAVSITFHRLPIELEVIKQRYLNSGMPRAIIEDMLNIRRIPRS